MNEMWLNLKHTFYRCFIDNNNWKLIVDGLKNSLLIAFVSVIIGIFIGIVVASICSSYDKNEEVLKAKGGFGYFALKVLNAICKIYIALIRGTPVVVQLLIGYFIIFNSWRNGVPVAMMVFGFNSGAYVAEIFRGGIMSIDNGQFEAGRSLGFNYVQTMIHIVIPQVIKNVLPTLCNEVITLTKETSIAGYVGIKDLAKAGDIIRASTYEVYLPLLVVAAIYLVIVVIMTRISGSIERRLRRNER